MYNTPRTVDSSINQEEATYVLTRRKLPLKIKIQRWWYTLAGVALDIDLPEQQPVTLCVRTLSGTGTVTANFRVQEEW